MSTAPAGNGTISARASAALRPQEMAEEDRPISEQFRVVALQYVDADAAASLLEETKSATLSQMMLVHVTAGSAVNKAEMLVKASPEWREFIEAMVAARAKANKLRLQLEYIRMKYGEWTARDATSRAEMRLR